MSIAGRVWVVVSVLALAASARADDKKKKPGLFDFETWKAPVTRQREAAGDLAPHHLDLTLAVERSGPPRPIRLRVYADRDYRELVMRWQSRARAQIERINAIAEPVFNVHFEIESLRPWDKSHFGVDLGKVSDELVALDPAREVDWVMALVTPLKGVATDLHAIGTAQLLGRHLVLRGMDDEQEMLAIDREFQLLPVEERRRLYGDRKGHKEIVVFLHEWGHTMGLLHHEDRTVVMNPAYDPHQRGLTDFEKQVVTLVLDRRLSHPSEPYPESEDLVALLGKAPRDEGSDEDRARLLAFVRARGRGAPPASAGAKPDSNPPELPAPDVDAFNRAVNALNAGKREQAWGDLSPVLERAGARKPSPATWARIAQLAAAIGALSAAEDAASRAGADPAARAVVESIESDRHRLALPLDAAKLGVPPDKEPAYVAAYWKATDALWKPDARIARAGVDEIAASFPGAPGVHVLRCELEARLRHVAQATKQCEAALEKFKGATRAHFLLGQLAGVTGKDAVAEQHFRRAILLDPRDPSSWRALASLYRQTGAKHRLAQLADEHRALLKQPLPE